MKNSREKDDVTSWMKSSCSRGRRRIRREGTYHLRQGSLDSQSLNSRLVQPIPAVSYIRRLTQSTLSHLLTSFSPRHLVHYLKILKSIFIYVFHSTSFNNTL